MEYRLDHIHLTTQDVERWIELYNTACGAEVVGSIDSFGTHMVNLNLGGMPLRISNRTGVEKTLSDERGEDVSPAEGHHHYGFFVDDLEAAMAEAESSGARIEVPPFQASPSLRCGFVVFPGEVRFELLQQMNG